MKKVSYDHNFILQFKKLRAIQAASTNGCRFSSGVEHVIGNDDSQHQKTQYNHIFNTARLYDSVINVVVVNLLLYPICYIFNLTVSRGNASRVQILPLRHALIVGIRRISLLGHITNNGKDGHYTPFVIAKKWSKWGCAI